MYTEPASVTAVAKGVVLGAVAGGVMGIVTWPFGCVANWRRLPFLRYTGMAAGMGAAAVCGFIGLFIGIDELAARRPG